MILLQKIKILSNLGRILRSIGCEQKWPGYEIGINEAEYEELVALTEKVHIYNPWFTPASVRQAFNGIGDWLTEEKLASWIEDYELSEENRPKTVALIMAGNIPLVGFHDFLAVFLSGHKALVKCSSDDALLFPALVKVMELFDPGIKSYVTITMQKMEGFDAVIATGSNNSANYFETYFGKYPHIIRKNRTSVAVLNGDETKDQLNKLGEDVFTYFGLGCRNVSMLLIPQNFELDRIFEAFYSYGEIINHHKYANNYDYNKAVNLMNQVKLLDNNFLLLKEDDTLNSPLGMLHYKRYQDKSEVEKYLTENKEEIQAIVGENYIPFGEAQRPNLNDYADGVDTLKFLSKL